MTFRLKGELSNANNPFSSILPKTSDGFLHFSSFSSLSSSSLYSFITYLSLPLFLSSFSRSPSNSFRFFLLSLFCLSFYFFFFLLSSFSFPPSPSFSFGLIFVSLFLLPFLSSLSSFSPVSDLLTQRS
jgi:hypothetical protein